MTKGLKSSKAMIREAALVELNVGVDHNDAASGVVDPLAQEVLTETPFLLLRESERDLRGLLLEARYWRPWAPFSNRASTDSWSILFSFLTMISGAFWSISLRSRVFLFRISGRVRSGQRRRRIRSPATKGRRSGEDGSTFRIIHSGRFSDPGRPQGSQPLGEFELLLEGVFRLQAHPQLFHLFGVNLA